MSENKLESTAVNYFDKCWATCVSFVVIGKSSRETATRYDLVEVRNKSLQI